MADTYIDMANKLIRFGSNPVSEHSKRGGVSSHPKNNPSRREMIDTIMQGMNRPKRTFMPPKGRARV